MPRQIKFSKYEGLGNDFIIIDEMNARVQKAGHLEPSIPVQNRIALMDRHLGIGADGIITVFSSDVPGTLAYMHITNADGSVPEMCGNGFRCLVMWLRDTGRLLTESGGAILTDSGAKKFFLDGDTCCVDMGIAHCRNELILLPMGLLPEQTEISATVVSMGNPHLVLELTIGEEKASMIGSILEHHPLFPNRTNVEFVTILQPNEIEVKVWERGVGLTRACGTGACAAVAAFIEAGKLADNEEIKVRLLGGDLLIKATGDNRLADLRMHMSGPARKIFDGSCVI